MNYLIPSNTKKGALIFSIFRPVDLIIFGAGLFFTFMLLIFIPAPDTFWTLVILSPAAVAGILIAPIPNYHNTLVVLQEVILFLNTRQKLIWKGWCFLDGEESSKK